MHSKYTNHQEESAIQEFKQNGAIYATIQKLGYPSPATLYRWLEHKKAGITNCHDFAGRHKGCFSQTHPAICPDIPIIRPQELNWMHFAIALELGEDCFLSSTFPQKKRHNSLFSPREFPCFRRALSCIPAHERMFHPVAFAFKNQ